MDNVTQVLRQLQRECESLSAQLEQINNALAALNAKGARRKRTLSAAAIARIRAGQKARWAKWRKAKMR